MNKTVVTSLVLLLLVSGVVAVWSAWKIVQRQEMEQQVRSKSVREAPPGSDEPILKEFTLTERSGRPLGSRDLEGDVWVASFFFSACPGSCRAQNMHVQSLQNKYAAKGVKFVSITCDPRVDTPERLSEYAASFQAKPDAWYFLTGDMSYIRRVGAEFFQIFVDERGHLDRFMAVDKWGNVRGYYDWANPAKLAELGTQLDEMIQETEPPASTLSVTAPIPVAHDEEREEDEKDGGHEQEEEREDELKNLPNDDQEGDTENEDENRVESNEEDLGWSEPVRVPLRLLS